jgi:hypothetical protein
MAEAAGAFVDEIEASMRFVRKIYKFGSEADRATAMARFGEARNRFAAMVREGGI